MKKITYFITSAPIEHKLDNHDIYDSFDLVSQGKREARLVDEAKKIIKENNFNFNIKKINKIYTATSGQTLETAKIINKVFLNNKAKIFPTDLLNGINFSMKQLISKEVFEKKDYSKTIIQARQVFVNNFFENKLTESKISLAKRIENFLEIIKKSKEDKMLCVGHSFYLKLLNIYLEDKNIFNNKNLLIKKFNPEKKPYNFLDGFKYIIN